jgi:cyclopropane fatty-acyl-phospholipid synthase-like methyltransferase
MIGSKGEEANEPRGAQLFDRAYARPGLLFGSNPTKIVEEVLSFPEIEGMALELGCGDGRDTGHLLKRGLTVVALDACDRAVKKLCDRRDISAAQKSRLSCEIADVRSWSWPSERFDFVIGITVLDHLAQVEVEYLVPKIRASLKPSGTICFEVHTTDDPGALGSGPKSELSEAISHYFRPNELLRLFQSEFRILHYSERQEWDFDHGAPHQHGFASLIGRLI